MINRTLFQNTLFSDRLSTVLNKTQVGNFPSKVSTVSCVTKRLDFFLETIGKMAIEAVQVTNLLDQDRLLVKQTESQMLDKLKTVQTNLLMTISNFNAQTSKSMHRHKKERQTQIASSTDMLSTNISKLSCRFGLMKERIETIQNTMGYYNARETHF